MIKPNKRTLFLIALLGPGLLASCQQESKDREKEPQDVNSLITMEISKRVFGHIDGKDIYSFHYSSSEGFEAELLEYGAIVTSIMMPDKTGAVEDVVLGYDDLQGYINDSYYFGATIGRVANRIGGAKVQLGGQEYKLAPNTLPDFGHHSYFNLAGAGNGTVLEHSVRIKADSYTVADEDLIPTGEVTKRGWHGG